MTNEEIKEIQREIRESRITFDRWRNLAPWGGGVQVSEHKCFNCGKTTGLYILLQRDGYGCKECCEKFYPRKVYTWKETYRYEMESLRDALSSRCDGKEYRRVMKALEKVLDSAKQKDDLGASLSK